MEGSRNCMIFSESPDIVILVFWWRGDDYSTSVLIDQDINNAQQNLFHR